MSRERILIGVAESPEDERALAGLVAQSRADLPSALEEVAASGADGLAAARIDSLAGSLAELAGVLRWLREAGAALVVLDVGLDTSAPGGRRTVDVLLAVADLERRRGRAGRPPPPGRPAVEPELRERIAAMRAEGMTLQAIADVLNEEGVPTPRGGTEWRPSSVQNAAGYRRPGPPGPLPRPAPPPPKRGPRGPREPGPRGARGRREERGPREAGGPEGPREERGPRGSQGPGGRRGRLGPGPGAP